MIVSASRRCDLPAHYLDWFMARVRAGYCLVANPFNAQSLRRVSLAAADVDALVFWTRDPRGLVEALPRLDELGLPSLVHLTMTGYPSALEPCVPPPKELFPAIDRLAKTVGPARILWRYDPILVAGDLGPEWHLENFAGLAASLEGRCLSVRLSLLDEYASTRSRLARAGFGDALFGSPRGGAGSAQRAEDRGESLPPEPYPSLLAGLAGLAKTRGMLALSCAEPYDLRPLGIEHGACIDAGLIEDLFGRKTGLGRDRHQRPFCRCAPSVDIGVYGACSHGCVYCYANRGRGSLLSPRNEDETLAPKPAGLGAT